ncbi:arginine--tRNA ligase [Winogradskyella aurantiaca]|uniref:arginine--tRNA ligase n=1 Tax=Winogradskyella aurantiaca TaxID=2219558 RepID=UPI000E1D3E7F|nr:arginine--tRNA ligase [Winogradskyella aurantiaca]
MSLQSIIKPQVISAVKAIFNVDIEQVEFQSTRPEFEGDITVVVFPLLRYIKGNPAVIGEQIGEYLKANVDEVVNFNVIKGFLNLVIADSYYLDFLENLKNLKTWGYKEIKNHEDSVIVEYSSPNTNKPLHLGHVRNVLLGYSVAEIIKASGKRVYKTQIINDRGIHICKSMLAWQRFGNGETPQSSGLKGDKLVGNYYVAFDKAYKEEIQELINSGSTEEEAKSKAPILLDAQEMLRQWEAGDDEVVALWEMMNQWVYDGFDVTYKNIGVDFDSYYYESKTYLLGKEFIAQGLEKGLFYKKEDGSVWCDLSDQGLDEKLLLRSDGTAVYMTQDIGTAIQRVKDHPDVGGMVYTVGNEQDYHFKVLFIILKKLGFEWADNLHHLSYGMVDLPSGKMKSREGTVVDADDLVDEMANTAKTISNELGKLDGYSEIEKEALYKTIGLGALKYFILKVDPKKRILFDPKESIDFQGNTGPFIQYTYARIQSILRKAKEKELYAIGFNPETGYQLDPKERQLIKTVMQFPEVIQSAAKDYSPALIANYVYDLVKEFNSFYQNVSILGADEPLARFRVSLSEFVAQVIYNGTKVLGIDLPNRM